MTRFMILTVSLLLILFPNNCLAGWFGPKNFEECVLETMQGQNKALLGMARKKCEKQFPYEKEIDLNQENIRISWGNEKGYLSISIESRSPDYILTRIDALFSKKNPAEINNMSDYTLLKTFTFSPDPKILGSIDEVTNSESYQSMVVQRAWGIMKKQ